MALHLPPPQARVEPMRHKRVMLTVVLVVAVVEMVVPFLDDLWVSVAYEE